LPKPGDWSDKDHVTGYWFNDAALNVEPDPATGRCLSAFLDVWPKPIYIGFGSMPVPNPQENMALLLDVLRRLGLRAIISRGWAGLESGSSEGDQFYSLGDVPHSWFFEKVAAVVHHGGAGTTATGLRAGCPTLVCPLGFDQPFWGRRVASLGCGPEPLPMRSWTPASLSASLNALTATPCYREKAQVIGKTIQAEDGVALAVACIRSAIGDP
jgi:UDP:flavonoid glycosyltransferase YjiC (YdhE family)